MATQPQRQLWGESVRLRAPKQGQTLARKYPGTGREWGWLYVVPARPLAEDSRTGVIQHYHVDANVVNKAIGITARKVRLAKRVAAVSLDLHPRSPESRTSSDAFQARKPSGRTRRSGLNVFWRRIRFEVSSVEVSRSSLAYHPIAVH